MSFEELGANTLRRVSLDDIQRAFERALADLCGAEVQIRIERLDFPPTRVGSAEMQMRITPDYRKHDSTIESDNAATG